MTTTAPQVGPGIYPGLSFEEYLAIDAASNSRLCDIDRSPAYCRWRIDNPSAGTDATDRGTALHMAVLEPDLFRETYVVAPEGMDFRTKEGRAWREEHAGAAILKTDEYLTVTAMRDQLLGHPMIRGAIEASEHREVSMVWIDPETGVLCKARYDVLTPKIRLLLDLKTSRAARPELFPRQIQNYRYYQQGAFYVDGARVLGLGVEHFGIAAVEATAPFEAYAYRLKSTDLDAGRLAYRPLLELYQRCVAEDDWPGGNDRFEDIGVPDYALTEGWDA